MVGMRKVIVAVSGLVVLLLLVVAFGYFGLLSAAMATEAFKSVGAIVLAFFGINYLKGNGGADK